MGLLRGYEAISQRSHAAIRALGAASACLLLGLLGAGLAVRGAHGAVPARVLTDPPTTTTPVTTTAPAPDPAPPRPKPKPKPKPKPARKPAPKPAPSTAPHVTTVHAKPSLTPAVKKVTPKVVRPKHKKVVHHKKARAKPPVVAKVKPKPKPTALPPQVPVGAESAAASSSGTRPDLTSTLIIGILGISMMVFALAAIPARVVPWRHVAYFIHQRHVDLTLFGIVLLATAAVAILLSKH